MSSNSDYQLRSIKDSEIDLILSWRNSERVRKNMYTDHIISIEEHKKWFSKVEDNNSVDYKIFTFRRRPVGIVGFTQIDRYHRRCYWGFYLGETDVPVKTGPTMELLALNYAFETLEMRKLCCEVFSFNQKVIKLHKKFGFQQEGVFLKHVLKGTQYEDVVSLSVFDDDWIKKEPEMSKLLLR